MRQSTRFYYTKHPIFIAILPDVSTSHQVPLKKALAACLVYRQSTDKVPSCLLREISPPAAQVGYLRVTTARQQRQISSCPEQIPQKRNVEQFGEEQATGN